MPLGAFGDRRHPGRTWAVARHYCCLRDQAEAPMGATTTCYPILQHMQRWCCPETKSNTYSHVSYSTVGAPRPSTAHPPSSQNYFWGAGGEGGLLAETNTTFPVVQNSTGKQDGYPTNNSTRYGCCFGSPAGVHGGTVSLRFQCL